MAVILVLLLCILLQGILCVLRYVVVVLNVSSNVSHIYTHICPVHSGDDCKAFQHDLNLVSTWCSKWQMRLNVSKCELLCISNQRSPVRPAYYINNCHLQWASSVKYLGVVVDSKLSWNDHISHISSKASKTLNLLRRHMFTCHTSSKHKAFRAFGEITESWC